MAVDYTRADAVISSDGLYRYSLTREWRLDQNRVYVNPCVFIMLNPSTADSNADDPTIRKCVGFAQRWGYEKLVVVNLFAYRATKPDDLFRSDYPVGAENAHHVRRVLDDVGKAICAWGANGKYLGQDAVMIGWLDALGVEPMVIGDGSKPNHPLYLPYGNPLSSFKASL